MSPSLHEIVASSCFFGALLHSFNAQKIEAAAKRSSSPTLRALLHFAGEIEVVFGLWAAVFILFLIYQNGLVLTQNDLQQKNFEEPIFVFVVMVIASTRPILDASQRVIFFLSKLLHQVLRISKLPLIYGVTLSLTPLLGSLITEPAAMTVSALLLKRLVLDHSEETEPGGRALLYGTLAVLFVNISIGGTLTSFAAPPVLMVARLWNWDSSFMFSHFGWKSSLAVLLNAALVTALNWKTLHRIESRTRESLHSPASDSPLWIRGVHLLFLLIAILSAHHPVFLIASFLFFMGFTHATESHQSPLKLRESLLVSFFLGGLVVLTAEQSWWLQPILNSLSNLALFLGATALTAITDNAAITSLAAQVSDLPLDSKYAVMEGAVVGGGLTLIANAPNPAGYSILRDRFREGGLSPFTLFLYALIPTLIAGVCLWIL